MAIRIAGGGGATTPATSTPWVRTGTTIGYDAASVAAGVVIVQLGGPNLSIPVNQTLQGQGARGGTDVNTAGATVTMASGDGTGAAAASSIIFQTPTPGGAGSVQQTMATRLTISTTDVTSTVSLRGPAGTGANVGIGVGGANTGFYVSGTLGCINNGSSIWFTQSTPPAIVLSITGGLIWGDSSFNTPNLFLTKGGAATLQLGAAAADLTAVSQTLQAQGVLVGGTADQAGGNLTINSGQGKGIGAISKISFRTPTLGVTGTVLQTMGLRVSIDQNQTIVFNRLNQSQGANVTAANDLTLGVDGNFFTITGNTQINAITTANWAAGSKFTLLFTGTPTVKHNTAGGAGTAVLFLASSVDLVAANNTILCLVFDGTQFQETSRKVA